MAAESSYLVVDLETIPDRELHNPPEPATAGERPFPPLYACRPIVIGAMWFDHQLHCKRIGTFGEGKDEAAMMSDFADFMTRYRPDLITWNGRRFDLPVLVMRALRHGLSFPWYYRGPARRRYIEEGHIDLCDELTDHGAAQATSLDAAARLIGLPGKDGVDGSQVEGFFNAGQIDAIRRYCLSDVAQTSFVFLRWRLLTGELDRELYRKAATDLMSELERDGRFARLLDGIQRERLLISTGPLGGFPNPPAMGSGGQSSPSAPASGER